jgi:hypothetical protein
MPHGWTVIGGTPDELLEVWGDPEEVKRRVHDMVTRSGAALDDVYFGAEDDQRVVALIHFCGKPADAQTALERVRDAFGPDSVEYFLSVEEKVQELEST